MAEQSPTAQGNMLDRVLRIFGDVRAGEGVTVLLMFLNIYFLLVAYYILKTVREPLILTGGGAELKSYAAAFQAVVLIAYVPLYGWVASRLPRQRLILAVVLFFVGSIQIFAVGHAMGLPYVGFSFFVWLGIFSVSMIAQFWSYANDVNVAARRNGLGQVRDPHTGNLWHKHLPATHLVCAVQHKTHALP